MTRLMFRVALIAAMTVCAMTLGGAASAADGVTLKYSLSIDAPATGVGNVTLEINGLSGDGFSLLRSRAAGQSWFDAVTAAGPAGAPMKVLAVDQGWYITTGGAPSARITYIIRPSSIGPYGHIGLITADWAALDGSLVFLIPGEEVTISQADFAATVPAAWQTVINWPASGDAYRADAPFAPLRLQLAKSLIAFGAFQSDSRDFGVNTLRMYTLSTYPADEKATLVTAISTIYGQVIKSIGVEMPIEYNAVCLPPAPDGLPVVAGAWIDGQAITLAGKFERTNAVHYAGNFARFVMAGYFAEPPFGVSLAEEDRWLYPAALAYAEGLGQVATKNLDENIYYADIYNNYVVEGVNDSSMLDLPIRDFQAMPPAARDFAARFKAPVLLMRLDLDIRAATGDTQDALTFLKALYAKGRSGAGRLSALEVLRDLTGADFTDFYDHYVRKREFILPTWPAFIAIMTGGKAPSPGEVAATVDEVPIHVIEVQHMADAVRAEGFITDDNDIWQAALTSLINEKMMDKAIARYKVDVIPQDFWRLRFVMPGRVMRLVIAKKRQALKDFLYNDWLQTERKNAMVVITPAGRAPVLPGKPGEVPNDPRGSLVK